jgi:hypothetical protein
MDLYVTHIETISLVQAQVIRIKILLPHNSAMGMQKIEIVQTSHILQRIQMTITIAVMIHLAAAARNSCIDALLIRANHTTLYSRFKTSFRISRSRRSGTTTETALPSSNLFLSFPRVSRMRDMLKRYVAIGAQYRGEYLYNRIAEERFTGRTGIG